jgi:hypothetical protein
MYWMLLPLDVNAGRHIEYRSVPLHGYWANVFRTVWDSVVHLLALRRR